MNVQQENQFEQDYDKFIDDGFLFTAKDESGKRSVIEALRLLRFYTRSYIEKYNSGCSSQSAFQIVRDTLASERELVPIASAPEEMPFTLTVQEYRSIPVRQVQFKWRNDLAFRAAVQHLIDTNQI